MILSLKKLFLFYSFFIILPNIFPIFLNQNPKNLTKNLI